MTVDAARQALFADVLCSDEARPAAVTGVAIDDARRRQLLQRAEALLRALSVVEDSRPEDSDERSPAEQAVRRLEAKVDLLVALVGGLLQRDQPADPVRLLQWSARGVAIEVPATDGCIPGGPALFRVQPSDALPEVLQLPATVLAIEPSPAGRRVWLQFDHLPATLESLLERHLFRMHRRAIAESRRQRAP